MAQSPHAKPWWPRSSWPWPSTARRWRWRSCDPRSLPNSRGRSRTPSRRPRASSGGLPLGTGDRQEKGGAAPTAQAGRPPGRDAHPLRRRTPHRPDCPGTAGAHAGAALDAGLGLGAGAALRILPGNGGALTSSPDFSPGVPTRNFQGWSLYEPKPTPLLHPAAPWRGQPDPRRAVAQRPVGPCQAALGAAVQPLRQRC